MRYAILGFRSGRTVRINDVSADFHKKVYKALMSSPTATRNYFLADDQPLFFDGLALEYVEVKEVP